MEGWIKLHRKLADNILWTCEPFTRGQAWVDLLMLANHTENYFFVRGCKINILRGQIAWSEPKLSERWKWSRTKLRKFLNDLEKEQQIIQQKNNINQIITIVKYEEYQEKEQQLIQQKDSRKTAERQQKDVNKNDKNDKNVNNDQEENNNTWRSNFEIYKSECEKVYKELLIDANFIAEQEKFHPGVDIVLTLEKSFVTFWGTEAGWKHKKKSRSNELNWRRTFTTAIDMNKVYKPKNNFHSIDYNKMP